ncbi:MAG TPA: DUF1194 domain-containing protein [Alphaproteobacteria bacterium]|nr:DUF1194 domain-containing protein [Alphaproteobacteria bacterium]
MRQALQIGCGILALALVWAAPPRAMAEAVDLELILAVDVSGSIDEVEAGLQRDGYLKAIVSRSVVGAITSGRRRRIAVTYVEWAGGHYQRTVVDWMVISDLASAKAFAAKLNAEPIVTAAWTSISGAMDFAIARFAKSPHKGTRRVVDISGDGRNNSGGPVPPSRAAVLAKGITINGLPIINDRPNPYGRPPDKNLDKYYKSQVIGGKGAFIVVAEGFEAFAEAIRAKLMREIAGRGGPRVVRIARRAPQPTVKWAQSGTRR